MGIPLRVTADRIPLEAALLALVDWPSGEVPRAGTQPPRPIELRLYLGDIPGRDGEPQLDVDGPTMRLSGDRFIASANASRRAATAWIDRSLARTRHRLAVDVIDPLLLFLVARSGRTPLHAAGVLLGKTAILLAGPSGAGKSSLALAAARAGLSVLSDDVVHVELTPRLRVWGLARSIHLLPIDAPAGSDRLRWRGGRFKTAIPMPVGARCTGSADAAVLCVLAPGEVVDLAPLEARNAEGLLCDRLDPGFDLLADGIRTVVRALAAAGAWRLTLSRDPAEAIAMLTRRFGVPRVS